MSSDVKSSLEVAIKPYYSVGEREAGMDKTKKRQKNYSQQVEGETAVL